MKQSLVDRAAEQEAHAAMREAFLHFESCERALERATKDEEFAREQWEQACREWEEAVRQTGSKKETVV